MKIANRIFQDTVLGPSLWNDLFDVVASPTKVTENQEKLLATVLARQEESDSAQAGREPQQADYDAVNNDMY